MWKAKETSSISSHQDAVFLYKIAIDSGPCATLLSSNLSALSAKFGNLNEVKEMTFLFSCVSVTPQDYYNFGTNQISAQSSTVFIHYQEWFMP